MKRLVGVAILVGITSGEIRAWADNADDLVTRAIDLRKSNRDQEALPLLIKAQSIDPSPRTYAHLGTCEQALGLWVQAEAHIQAALANDTDPWINKNELVLRKALEIVQSRIGSLEIWGSPTGARVSIDGDPVSTLPMTRPSRVLLGNRTVSVSAPGFATESRQIEARKGVFAVREHIVLRPIALAPTPEPLTPSSESETPSSKTTLINVDKASPTPTAKPIYKEWWFWGSVALTTIATGTVIILATHHNDSCSAPMGGTCTTF